VIAAALMGVVAAGPASATNTTWSQLDPATSPSARATGTAMTHDSATSQLVLFGSGDASGSLNDTWTWDGTTWTQLDPAVSPPPRWGGAMA